MILELSISDAELFSATLCTQYVIYVLRLINNIRLKEKFPIIIEFDNQGYVDLANNWTVGGRT